MRLRMSKHPLSSRDETGSNTSAAVSVGRQAWTSQGNRDEIGRNTSAAYMRRSKSGLGCQHEICGEVRWARLTLHHCRIWCYNLSWMHFLSHANVHIPLADGACDKDRISSFQSSCLIGKDQTL